MCYGMFGMDGYEQNAIDRLMWYIVFFFEGNMLRFLNKFRKLITWRSFEKEHR